jgi:hypothetical protein
MKKVDEVYVLKDTAFFVVVDCGGTQLRHNAFTSEDQWEAIEFASKVKLAGRINPAYWTEISAVFFERIESNFFH